MPRACPDGMLTAEALVPIRSVYRHRPGLSALGDSLEANIANPPLAAVASHERLPCENPSVVTLRRSDDPQAANVGRAWLGVDNGSIVHCVFDRVLGGKSGRHQRNEQQGGDHSPYRSSELNLLRYHHDANALLAPVSKQVHAVPQSP